MQIDSKLLHAALEHSKVGIVIAQSVSSSENPLIYVNPAFEALTGYSQDEIIGKDCRFLNTEYTDQAALEIIRNAIRAGESCKVVLRNFKKNGNMFLNELTISPVYEGEKVTHFIGVQYDVTERVRNEQKIKTMNQILFEKNQLLKNLVFIDHLTQLHNRSYFEEQLNLLWNLHERLNKKVAIIFIDVDCFKLYNDHYGHVAGDDVLRLVARTLKQHFARESDIVARYGGEEFVVASSPEDNIQQLMVQVESLKNAIIDLKIEHAKAITSPYLSVSVGVCYGIPPQGKSPSLFTREADNAMYIAKRNGGNAVEEIEYVTR